jgi:hypothetical protein
LEPSVPPQWGGQRESCSQTFDVQWPSAHVQFLPPACLQFLFPLLPGLHGMLALQDRVGASAAAPDVSTGAT